MSRILVLFLLTFSSLFAQEVEEFPFIGVTVSFDSTDILTTENNIDTLRTNNIGIRYGQQTVDWRSMLTYNRSSDQKTFTAEIDKILLDELFGTSMLRPYLGFAGGIVRYDNQNLLNESAYFLGLNAGLIVYATDNIDADIAYHYYETLDNDEIANMQGATFSVHYFY